MSFTILLDWVASFIFLPWLNRAMNRLELVVHRAMVIYELAGETRMNTTHGLWGFTGRLKRL